MVQAADRRLLSHVRRQETCSVIFSMETHRHCDGISKRSSKYCWVSIGEVTTTIDNRSALANRCDVGPSGHGHGHGRLSTAGSREPTTHRALEATTVAEAAQRTIRRWIQHTAQSLASSQPTNIPSAQLHARTPLRRALHLIVSRAIYLSRRCAFLSDRSSSVGAHDVIFGIIA